MHLTHLNKLFMIWNADFAARIKEHPENKIALTEELAQKKTTYMRIVGILDIEDNQT